MKQLGVLLVVLGLLAVGCGGTATVTRSDIPAAESDPAEQAQQAEPTVPAAEPTVAPPSDEQPEPTPVPEPTEAPSPTPTPVPGVGGWSDGIEVGSCFNSGGDGVVVPVDCEADHENELFLLAEFPAGPDAPFVEVDAFTDEVFETICDDATEQFAGAPWSELPFRTAVWAPSEAQWLAGDRTVGCTAQSGLEERPNKIGTAAGGSLVSDDGIVARSSVGGQSDLFFSFQASTLYPLTSGEFDLPGNSPQVAASGVQFGSREQGAEAGAQAWTYLFDTLEVAQLETGLPESWEVASVHFIVDIPSFMFAARENEDDDWEIYVSTTDGGAIALTDNDLDDQFPSLSPDEDLILWSSGGDIWSMDIDGNNKVQLTNGPGDAFETQMSPDGSTVLFTSSQSGNEDVWSMAADGSNQVNLTNHPAIDAWPFFSEDGSIIYFQTDRAGVNAILMMMEPDGSNQSYFSFEYLTNAALLPDAITERFQNELTPIGDVLDESTDDDADEDQAAGGGLVEGELSIVAGSPDELNVVEHSQGRIATALPGGWEYREQAGDDVLSLVAAPSLSEFDERWDTFGVTFTIADADDAEAVVSFADLAPAANDRTCVEDSDTTEVAGDLTTTIRRYSCGNQGQAVVVAIFDSGDATALVFEGQWADDDGTSAELIEEISDATRWG